MPSIARNRNPGGEKDAVWTALGMLGVGGGYDEGGKRKGPAGRGPVRKGEVSLRGGRGRGPERDSPHSAIPEPRHDGTPARIGEGERHAGPQAARRLRERGPDSLRHDRRLLPREKKLHVARRGASRVPRRAGEEARRNHARVVQDEEVAFPEKLRKIAEAAVPGRGAREAQDVEAGFVARRRGALRDPVRRKLIVEVGGAEGQRSALATEAIADTR